MEKSYILKLITIMLISIGISAVIQAQNFHLVKDINTSTDSYPFGSDFSNNYNPSYITLNGISYFIASNGTHGTELWRSDGTSAGTYLVKDINPGAASSGIYYMTVSNNKLFFSATNASATELWVSDGTAAGTHTVPGPTGYLNALTDVGGILYFFDGMGNLWKSDGTAAGTEIAATLSNAWVFSDRLVTLNGILYFIAFDFTYGVELFRTDGTTAGTYLVKDINVSGDSYPFQLTVVNEKLYFSADDGSGRKLWVSDGQTMGTMLATNSNDVNVISDSRFFATIGNTIYFSGNTSTAGSELFKYNTNAPGVTLVKNIAAGSDSSNPQNIINVEGTLFFSAKGPDGNTGLWKSDGTDAGTQLVKNSFSNTSFSFYNFYNANGELYFTHSSNTYGAEIWKSDGTEVGTHIVKDIYPGASRSTPNYFTSLDGWIIFSANDGSTGIELWRSNGTSEGTSLIKDINKTTTSGSNPYSLVNFNNTLFFSATENEHGAKLWKSNGTAEGTSLYKDILPGSIGSNPYNITPQKDNLYFFTYADTLKLWKLTGANGTITLIKTFLGNNLSPSYNFSILAADNLIYFSITNYTTQENALWRSDGTSQGTYLLKSGLHYGSAHPAAVVGDNIFVADVTYTNADLWKSDGTVAGTMLVRSFQPGGAFYEIDDLYAFNDEVFFGADGGEGLSFWKSDGTEAGTVFLKQIWRPGISGYAISNGALFFDADDNSGRHLWKTDGTAEGTKLVKKIGTYGSYPQDLTDVNGILYFTASANDYSPSDSGRGRELYRSDGTEEGTYLVKDITPGLGSTNIFSYTTPALVNGNGTLYFTVFNESYTNSNLWQSDGTEEGTQTVKDDNLAGVTYVSNVTAVGSQLFFTGTTYQFGTELYAGSTAKNKVPVVSITSPANNTSYVAPADIPLIAELQTRMV